MAMLANLRRKHQHNIATLRAQPLSEISGALGDLGTLLPLLIALTTTSSISLPSTLVFTGLANILTGLFFGIPLPVQPMKAIAAVAISRNFTIRENMAAGITVSACVFLLSVTGLLGWFGRVIPIPVVKGIQVGAGLSLIISGGSNLLAKLDWTEPAWSDNHFWTIFGFLFLATSTVGSAPYTRIRIPYALVIAIIGLTLASIALQNSHGYVSSPALWDPQIYIPRGPDFKVSLSASLGQLPLTTLNSIIAVTHLSHELLPNLDAPSPTALGLSVAGMNLISCWVGGMPACHGSGGLAGQYRFGARSGASIVMLGTVKLVVGLFVGDALIGLLERFPRSLLGIMVIAAGIELAQVASTLISGATDLWETTGPEDDPDETGHLNGSLTKRQKELSEDEQRQRWTVMLVTVAGLLAFKNDAVGFVAGLTWHWIMQMPTYVSRWRTRRSWISTQNVR